MKLRNIALYQLEMFDRVVDPTVIYKTITLSIEEQKRNKPNVVELEYLRSMFRVKRRRSLRNYVRRYPKYVKKS